MACRLQCAPVSRDNRKLWHNEHRRRISQKHNRENTPKDIHCRMNHRFLGKCRRGSARSPASMWGLPIIRGSDLNVTYIIAFFPCRGSLVEHRKSIEKQKNSTVPRLVRVNAVILQPHCFYGVSVSESFAPGSPTHIWKRDFKCHIFSSAVLVSKKHYITHVCMWITFFKGMGESCQEKVVTQ